MKIYADVINLLLVCICLAARNGVYCEYHFNHFLVLASVRVSLLKEGQPTHRCGFSCHFQLREAIRIILKFGRHLIGLRVGKK